MINPKEPNVSDHGLRSPQSRYVLPSFVERTSYGIKEMNPYNKLFEERIIFLGVQIDDASANDVMAQLLTLEAIDPDRDRWFTAEEAKEYGFVDQVIRSAVEVPTAGVVS
jgi:ATP-dependent protease ClpP protease subunit